jgi:hypothetical protein
MAEATILKGYLRWVGEHWVNAIRRPGQDVDSGRVSLYNTHYCAAGAGKVAVVTLRGDHCWEAICTDDRDVAGFVASSWIRGQPREYRLVDAKFTPIGDIREDPGWVIKTGEHQIVAVWRRVNPPVVAYRGGDPQVVARRSVFNLLFFAQEAEIVFDGHRIEGRPYFTDIWRDNLGGGDRSSCVFALAETFTNPAK